MMHADFHTGLDFRYRDQSWRVTDVGTRTIAAICLSEVWVTRSRANSGIKERVRVTSIDPKRFAGPPYGVPETVFDERTFASCVTVADFEAAKRILRTAAGGG